MALFRFRALHEGYISVIYRAMNGSRTLAAMPLSKKFPFNSFPFSHKAAFAKGCIPAVTHAAFPKQEMGMRKARFKSRA